MSDDSSKSREQIEDAAQLICRAVRRARLHGGNEGQAQIERLAQEWPELARGIGRLLAAEGTVRPQEWRGLRRPDGGWGWEG